MKKYKLLIADDEYWIRQNLKFMVDWDEYSIDFLEMACDGEDAMKKIEENCPDILITDINMPFVSGIELINNIKDQYSNIKVIVLSGYSEFEYVRQALVNGAIDYLLKPIEKEDLIDVIKKVISLIEAGRKLEQEKEATNHKLIIAKSVLQDREYSEFIDNNKIKVGSGDIASNIWPDVNGFFLALIKTDRISKIAKKLDITDVNQLLFQIKEYISDQIDSKNSIVFNNIFVQNEFILIADLSKLNFSMICDKVIRIIKQYTYSDVSIAISRYYTSFDEIRNAYNDALLAIMTRKFCAGSYKIDIEDVGHISAIKRVTSEQENQLIYAAQNKNKKLVNKLLYEDMQIQKYDCGDYIFLEIKQIIDKVARIIYNNSLSDNSPTQILTIDNLMELLNMALENFNMADVCNIIDQIVDECLDTNDSIGSNETVKQTVRQVEKYIDENYFEDISLATLANTFLISKSYLSKAFKQEIGVNVMLYIAKKRIDKSLEYIKQDDLSLTEISSLVGYDDYAYFNRVFRKIMGKGPREYKSGLS